MAWSSAGGTDRVSYTGNFDTMGTNTIATVAFRFKTTQATANTQLFGRWNSSSRSGYGVLLNNTANKASLNCYATVNQQVLVAGTTTVNDGNWHSLVLTLDTTPGNPNRMYIDGNLDASANAAGAWTCLDTNWSVFGDSADTFWATYIGDIADYAHWDNVQLTTDEITSYAGGVSGRLIRPSALRVYAPLVRDTKCLRGNTIPSASGGSVSAHPRVVGSSA